MKAESIAIGHCESTQPRTSGPTTTASACGRAPQTSSRPRAVAQDHQARAYGLASVVEPSVRAPIDGQRVRLARLMANPERDHEESDRTFWMADSKHHRTEATCRLRDVRLDAAAESRPVTAFRLAGQQPLTWKTAEPIEVAPSAANASTPPGPSRARSSAIASSSKATGKTGSSALTPRGQPSPSRGKSPKWLSNTAALNRCSP